MTQTSITINWSPIHFYDLVNYFANDCNEIYWATFGGRIACNNGRNVEKGQTANEKNHNYTKHCA